MSVNKSNDSKQNREKEVLNFLHEIEIATENMDEQYIDELKAEAEKMFETQSDNPDAADIFWQIKKAQMEIAEQKRFNETKRVMKESYMAYGMSEKFAEECADEFAWQERYEDNSTN